ncbi:winged helix-turn-helix domain-containing protein [Streptomyces sp. NPDC053048]|uniref:AfsR/SARP family transcriptional regulator n=1 Tax=Streptomyces sp. NPDC053048 TaxID=3365694 RepID=UPI0037CFE7D0
MTLADVRPGAVSFTLLGPVSARVGEEPVVVDGRRQRVVLSLLVLARGRVVPTDTLIDAVWGDHPPFSARTRIALCVRALRRAFRAAGHSSTVIAAAPPGYRLRTERAGFDVRRFDDLVTDADRAAGRGELIRAGTLYGGALDLWSGPALQGVGGRLTEGAAARLEARRRVVCEALLDVGQRLADDGLFDEAGAALRSALRAAEALADPALTARAHLTLARHLVTIRRLTLARRHFRAAAALDEGRADMEPFERGPLRGEALDLVPRQAVR